MYIDVNRHEDGADALRPIQVEHGRARGARLRCRAGAAATFLLRESQPSRRAALAGAILRLV